MLETEFGFRVGAMYLGQVHPCLPRARLITVPCMREELELMVEDQIHRGDAFSGALPDATFALPHTQRFARRTLLLVRACISIPFLLLGYCLTLSRAVPILCVKCFRGSRCRHLRALCSFLAVRMKHGGCSSIICGETKRSFIV